MQFRHFYRKRSGRRKPEKETGWQQQVSLWTWLFFSIKNSQKVLHAQGFWKAHRYYPADDEICPRSERQVPAVSTASPWFIVSGTIVFYQSQFNLNKIYFFHLNGNSVQIIRYNKTTSQKQSTFKLTVFWEIVTSDSYSNPANNLINNCPSRKYALRPVWYWSVTSRNSPIVLIRSFFISV